VSQASRLPVRGQPNAHEPGTKKGFKLGGTVLLNVPQVDGKKWNRKREGARGENKVEPLKKKGAELKSHAKRGWGLIST